MVKLREPVYWIGEVPSKCEVSGLRIYSQFVDGRIPRTGTWAAMHPRYFIAIGGMYGAGNGQLYQRKRTGPMKGRWLKIKG